MSRQIRTTLWTVLAGAMGIAQPIYSQCTFDWYSGGPLAGTYGNLAPRIDALCEWDPDGLGPQAPLLFAAGQMAVAGQYSTGGVAIWNGLNWLNAGGGLGTNEVVALSLYNGQVIAGGGFQVSPNLRRIASWNGTQWQPLGPGLNNTVRAIAVYNGDLIAGGEFTSTFDNSVAISRVARWNGSTWQPLGSGLNNTVKSLWVYNNELVAGGDFVNSGTTALNKIARWTGSTWQPLGAGSSSGVLALCEYNGELIATGNFSAAAGPEASRIARWNGSAWMPLGTGTLYNFSTLQVWNDKVIASGNSPPIITSWDGSNWENMPAGFGGSSLSIQSLGIYNGELYAGGNFSIPGRSLARFDGAAWQRVGDGMNDWVYSLTEHQGSLYFGGIFLSAGNIEATRIAQWTPGAKEEWRPLGAGVDGLVFTMLSYGNDLIAGGSFTQADGNPVGGIARWDGKTFSPVGTGFQGGAPPTTVYELVEFRGKIIAAGRFANAGSRTVNNIASWDGSEWTDLGGGMDNSVIAMTVWNGSLYAGGYFTTAGGVPVRRIARWDGSNWYPVGEGCDQAVFALHVYNDQLIAGGELTQLGKNILSRWNGSTWAGIDTGASQTVNGLTTYNGELIVAGDFATSVPFASKIIKYDQNWIASGLGTGLEYSHSWVLTPYKNELIAGGKFIKAGGKGTGFWARWHPTCPRGDMNCDNLVNDADINPFVNVILAPATATDCQKYLADLNADGLEDGSDITPFLASITP